jgi:hypothetical protein
MKENPVRSLMRIICGKRPVSPTGSRQATSGPYKSKCGVNRPSEAYAAVVFLCCAAYVLGGCSVRKRPSIPWATAVQVKPVAQAHTVETSSVSEDLLPDFQFELPPFPGRLIAVRSAPPRPHTSTPPATATGSDTEKPETPTIAPQQTPQESAVAQQQTNQSLGIAERNLEFARGKILNAAQSDLVSKIRSFIKDAREAAQITDWSRARSLAKKAQVLSEELAASL